MSYSRMSFLMTLSDLEKYSVAWSIARSLCDSRASCYKVLDISPSHHHHPPIYNIKRSTVNVYTIDIAVDRLGSGLRVSASFQTFALTAGANVIGGEGNCPGGPSKCPGAGGYMTDGDLLHSFVRPVSEADWQWQSVALLNKWLRVYATVCTVRRANRRCNGSPTLSRREVHCLQSRETLEPKTQLSRPFVIVIILFAHRIA